MRTPIILEGVTCHYGRQTALDGIDLTLPPCSITALTGHNGSGKSTVLMALAGLITPTQGTISGLPNDVAFVPQHSAAPDQLPITVRTTVAMGRWRLRGPLGRLTRKDHEIIDECLEQLGISDLAGRRLGSLSGGQRQRSLVAQGLAQHADLLLLDEPLAGVDTTAADHIGTAVDRARSTGITVVVATHDAAQAEHADLIVRLRHGMIADEAGG